MTQYLLSIRYGDGSTARKVGTWAEIVKMLEKPPLRGATMTVEEL